MDKNQFNREVLNGLPIGAVQFFATTESTNDDAHTWLDQGAPDLSIVIADEQTKGRGRFLRKWVTQSGAALASSLIVHPSAAERNFLHLYSPLAGIAVAATLEKMFSLHAQIKWPNDVLVAGKKICGILSETAWIGTDLRGIVIGTGLNITTNSLPPADMLTFPATSVEGEIGQPVDRWLVLREYLSQFILWRTHLGDAEFFDYWRSHLAFKGESVEIQGALGNEIEGILLDIAENGDLLIQTSAGTVPVKVGDVHLRLRQK